MIGGLGASPDHGACSRAECRKPATWRIDWRNPRIHTADRGKTWLACDEHVDYLRGFLEARSFPVAVAAFDVIDEARSDAADGGRP
ncbi:hypothetical protein DCE93_07635 [Agromyces badenianii]|uniref:Uncharacterized protein n=1 Tax=Agromyces badenianii TaxID=2080742 RepID=A0A2S0WW22_9MICO|nr:hypothetical protein [Agromyces badenianii]AWB95546.1 hypothetical protein DCE93_07635 [Agromyces badenianii]PWC04154.1 hypothetical protein DCE94_08300 [Agromyces badenianii]